MANIYKIKLKFPDDEEAKYTVTDAVVTFDKQPNNLSMPAMTACHQTITFLLPLLKKAGIKKLTIEEE